MGDASGVGPEIVLRHHVASGLGDAVVYGDASILRHGISLLGLALDPERDVVAVSPGDELPSLRDGLLRVVDLARLT
eukprot:gene4242-5597_t